MQNSRVGEVVISKRIESIDLLRGIIIIIMALDHVRDYFHADSLVFAPEDLSQSNPFIFFTRWITHFCAPVFVFLAGTSAFLSGQKKTKSQLSKFLLTRGLWLIILEFTVINFAWSFNYKLPFIGLQVIWAIGVSMIILAAIIHLPFKIVFAGGALIVAGHNLLDNIHFDSVFWSALHEPKIFTIGEQHMVRFAYPVLPWIGIMILGYCFGKLYTKEFSFERRKKWLLTMGIGAIALFVIIRAINIYGDPAPWAAQNSAIFSFLSFLNTTKYPPSILYTLMTLGPAMLFLTFAEKLTGGLIRAMIHIGRVPMFFYIMHLYLIHVLAMIAAEFSGYNWTDMILQRRTWIDPQLKGYGFSLGTNYLVWIGIILLLYPLCKWYDQYKTNHKEKWWLSYL
ncbi:MAG: DUF1624 domain-containing protein [Flavisolibacter sp.]|nr:DUF1624 domain-containing protein [Flavisolibacter sp.]